MSEQNSDGKQVVFVNNFVKMIISGSALEESPNKYVRYNLDYFVDLR